MRDKTDRVLQNAEIIKEFTPKIHVVIPLILTITSVA